MVAAYQASAVPRPPIKINLALKLCWDVHLTLTSLMLTVVKEQFPLIVQINSESMLSSMTPCFPASLINSDISSLISSIVFIFCFSVFWFGVDRQPNYSHQSRQCL